MNYNALINLLKNEVKPALGCTEPAAVALAVAQAKYYLGCEVNCIKVEVSPNIFKNAMGVYIPNTKETGLKMAAALGAVIGRPEKELQLLKEIQQDELEKAYELIKNGNIQIKLSESERSFFIAVHVEGACGWAEVDVADSHTNVVRIIVNEEKILVKENVCINTAPFLEIADYKISDLIIASENMPLKEIAFLKDGIEMNMNMAYEGMKFKTGMGVGTGLQDLVKKGLLPDDIVNKVRIAVAAACDARMAGINYPVMSTMGSGNHGILAIIPIAVFGKEINASEEAIIRALAISNLVTAFVKHFTGKLSPLCGCAVAAGVGVSAALCWLMGGSIKNIEGAIKNIIGNLTGMVCDGAKGGCALKLSTSGGEAIMAARLAIQEVIIDSCDGIISKNVEETIKNLGYFCKKGMEQADKTIIEIMMKKEEEMKVSG